jgi:hypothetical protein
VTHLKSELGQLKDRMQEMSNNIDKLTSLVNDLILDKMNRDTKPPAGEQKKRKINKAYDPAAHGAGHYGAMGASGSGEHGVLREALDP